MKVFPPDQLVAEAVKLGEKIAAQSPLMVGMAKQAVNRAYETTLEEGCCCNLLRHIQNLFVQDFFLNAECSTPHSQR